MEFQLDKTLAADSFLMGQFELCDLLLMNDVQFPWFTLVPRRSEVSEIFQLSEADQMHLWQESNSLSKVLMAHFGGDKLNIAAIGNIVSQLHLHHVVRFKNDGCWPKPIWGQQPMLEYTTEKAHSIMTSVSNKLQLVGFRPLN